MGICQHQAERSEKMKFCNVCKKDLKGDVYAIGLTVQCPNSSNLGTYCFCNECFEKRIKPILIKYGKACGVEIAGVTQKGVSE